MTVSKLKQELRTVARDILNSILYMTLGTADENGTPWVSPVYFSSADHREFYWISSPEAKHSKNLLVRPQISIVVFDSRIPAGMGQAVYMAAVAEQVHGSDLAHGLSIYNGRFENPSEHGARIVMIEAVSGSGVYRLYRAIVQESWVLDPDNRPDRRKLVDLQING